MLNLTLKHYTAIASILLAVFFAYGMSVQLGYLSYWKIPIAFFPLSFEEIAYSGYLSILNKLAPHIFNIIVILLTFGLLYVAAFLFTYVFLIPIKRRYKEEGEKAFFLLGIYP